LIINEKRPAEATLPAFIFWPQTYSGRCSPENAISRLAATFLYSGSGQTYTPDSHRHFYLQVAGANALPGTDTVALPRVIAPVTVTAPASIRPQDVEPAFIVIEVSASMFPLNIEDTPIVAELPTCQ
jgi:hypothetical protein